MAVVGKVRYKHPSGIRSLDVVDLGDSFTGKSLRIKIPSGIKEFNLVTLDDSRASPVRIKTPAGILSLAADGRNSISHTSSASLSASQSSPGQILTRERLLGRTSLNKVIRIVLDVRMRLEVDCGYNASIFSGFDSGDTRCRIKAVNVSSGAEYLSPEVVISGSRRHDALAYFDDIVIETDRTVTLSGIPAAMYDVYMLLNGYRSPSEGHLSSTAEYAFHSVRCQMWHEHTK